MTEDMHVAAKRRAEALGMNFSNYINALIREDMTKGGSLVIRETPGETLPPPPHKPGKVNYRKKKMS